MNNNEPMNNKYKFISAIIQLVLSLVLVGISVYYLLNDKTTNFLLFLGVGVVLIGLSVRTIYKWCKDRKNGDDNK